MHHTRFGGVAACRSGRSPGEEAFEELDRAVNEMGFVGCIINPDPGEGAAPPALGDEYCNRCSSGWSRWTSRR